MKSHKSAGTEGSLEHDPLERNGPSDADRIFADVDGHVSGCCGVNAYLSHRDESVVNVCKSRKLPNENIYHITTCLEKDRTTFFQACVDDVVKWTKKARTDPVLVSLI